MSEKKRRRLSAVTPAMCGDTKTFARSTRGESTGSGSGSKTSRHATMSPRCRRARSAAPSTTLPRETLTNTHPGRSSSSSSGPSIPSVRGGVRHEDEDDVALEDLFEGPELDPVGLGQCPRDERVEDPHLDLEGTQQLDEAPAQVAEADQADPLVAQLGAVEARARALATGTKAFSWAIMRRKLAPALRSPTRARPSAHSAAGHDEPWLVSTTRTPRAWPASMSRR